MFELNKPDWYEVKDIAEIEDFDKDQYGNTWYNVVFHGDADTFMWLAKNEPEPGRKYYGHLELTKSGKGTRFKTDPKPEDGATIQKGQQSSYEKPAWKDNSKDITLGLVYKTFVQAEGMMPQTKEHWAVIIANWNTLVAISAGTFQGVELDVVPDLKAPIKEKLAKSDWTKEPPPYNPMDDIGDPDER
jgi:hypothetical protein